MAGQIRMTPDKMRQRAGEYATQRNNMHSVITKLDALLKNLQNEWEGNASEAYAARFQELRPSFVQAENLIEEISVALKNTANAIEETDKSIASKFKG